MKKPKDPFRDYVLHPRYGERPRLTRLNTGPRSKTAVANTGLRAQPDRQVPSRVPRLVYFDEKRVCVDCGRPFLFFAEEQRHWYEELGFNLRADCVRCFDCRKEIQEPKRLKYEYDDLQQGAEPGPAGDLRMAELMVDLIECGWFMPRKTEHVRRLLKSVADEQEFERRREALWSRVRQIEGEANKTIELPAHLVRDYAPSRDELFELCSNNLTVDMVREISEADYGYDADVNFQEIQRLRTEGASIDTFRWNPCEVLELMRWSEPAREDWKPGSTGERGHRIRAFCCAALLSANALPEIDDPYDQDDTLIQLIDSALALQGPMPSALMQFLLWRIPCDDGDNPYFALGLMILALHPTIGPHPPARVASIIRFVERLVFSHRRLSPGGYGWPQAGIRAERWLAHFEELLKRYRNQRLRVLIQRLEPLFEKD